SNPWVSVFDGDFNFRHGFENNSARPQFVNQAPRPGEEAAYATGARNGVPSHSFALVLLKVERSQAGAVRKAMMLEGLNMEATEAAWDFVSNAEASEAMLTRAGITPSSAKQSYRLEILLRTETM